MITIKVFMNGNAQNSNSAVLSRRINYSSQIRFPVEETNIAMKAIFGAGTIVVYEFD